MGSRGAWACAAGALEQDLNANGHNIIAASSVKPTSRAMRNTASY